MYNAERRQQLLSIFFRSAKTTQPADRRKRAAWLRKVARGLSELGALRVTPDVWPDAGEQPDWRTTQDR